MKHFTAIIAYILWLFMVIPIHLIAAKMRSTIDVYDNNVLNDNNNNNEVENHGHGHRMQSLQSNNLVDRQLPGIVAEGRRRRFLQNNDAVQVLRLLVVRIFDSNDIEPNETISDIEYTIFGTLSEENNVTAITRSPITSVTQQIASMTHGKLELVPISQLSVPVLDVSISIPINNETEFFNELAPEMINATQQTLQQQNVTMEPDITIFCIPNGSSLGGKTQWKAVAVKNEPYAYFQNSYCTYMSPVIHELGHAIFGYYHSSKEREEYGDRSCYMGLIDIDTPLGHPLKAFNAHKHWLSGWFRNRTVIVNMTIPDPSVWVDEYRLVSFVDYSNHNELLDIYVVLLVVADLYIQYDIPKGYNIDSWSSSTGNVMITQANDTMSYSFAVANLTSGQLFRYQSSVNDTSVNIVIEVCSTGNVVGTLDYSIVRLYVDNGDNQSSQCNTSRITDYPTGAPIPVSSDSPSSMQSSTPTNTMSSFPSLIPSFSTSISSQSPTITATIMMFPSSSPTPRPLQPPSIPSPVEPPITISSGTIRIYGRDCSFTNFSRQTTALCRIWVLAASLQLVIAITINFLEGHFVSIIM